MDMASGAPPVGCCRRRNRTIGASGALSRRSSNGETSQRFLISSSEGSIRAKGFSSRPTVCPGDLSNSGSLLIGNHPTPGFQGSYHGIIDELSLYRRALGSNEISAIYNAGNAGKCPNNCTPPPSGLVGWWTGDGTTMDVLNTNNGTLVGGTTYAPGEVG